MSVHGLRLPPASLLTPLFRYRCVLASIYALYDQAAIAGEPPDRAALEEWRTLARLYWQQMTARERAHMTKEDPIEDLRGTPEEDDTAEWDQLRTGGEYEALPAPQDVADEPAGTELRIARMVRRHRLKRGCFRAGDPGPSIDSPDKEEDLGRANERQRNGADRRGGLRRAGG